MLIIWLFMVSKMEFAGSQDLDDRVTQERADSIQTMLSEKKPDRVSVEDRSSGIFMNAVTTFLVLISLLGIVWLWSRKKPAMGRESEFHEIGEHALGQGAQIKVLEINEEIWVLGVTSGSISLLHRYPKEAWVKKSKTPEQETSIFYKLFSSKT